MPYESLYSLYRKKKQMEWESEYRKRFESLTSHPLPFEIKQFGYPQAFPAFYCATEEMLLLQEKIFSAVLSLKEILRKIPGAAVAQFLRSCLVVEVQSSSAIEGVHSSRREIREVLLTRGSSRFSGIVNKYTKILNHDAIPLETCRDLRALYDDFILSEVVAENPKNAPDGQLFRKDSVDIVSGTQKILHRGVEPEEKIIQYMESVLLLLHDDSIPFLLRISIFHYLFGYIHPFYDGNGRMSRFITSYLLAKEYDPTIALRLSLLLKTKRSDYYKLFTRTTSMANCGDLTPFILSSLEFVLAAANDTKKNLSERDTRLSLLYEKLDSLLRDTDATTREIYSVLTQAAVFSDIGATVQEIQSALKKSRGTIDAHLKKIPRTHLRIIKEGRVNHYRLNLQIFEP